MAFATTNSQIKNNILNYARHLISKTLYRAIEILFRPCCDITILSVQNSCNIATPGTYDLTITLDKSTNMLGNGVFLVSVDGTFVTADSGNTNLFLYNDGTVITLEGVDIGSTAGGNKSVDVLFLLPTGLPPIQNITNMNQLTPGVFTLGSGTAPFSFVPCVP
jgi:hypothetical protein